VKPSDLLATHRNAIRQVVAAHRAEIPRVFGSVLRAEGAEASDLDLLVDPTKSTAQFDIGAIRAELYDLLGVQADAVTPRALPEKWHARVVAEVEPV
jgi:predicted nucleotidyltransferase